MIILLDVGTHGPCVRENDQKHPPVNRTHEPCVPTSSTLGNLAYNHYLI